MVIQGGTGRNCALGDGVLYLINGPKQKISMLVKGMCSNMTASYISYF